MPGFHDLLKHGAKASGNGLLTQAAANTGAGWFTLTTGAWPSVHGSTNNTFHVNGQFRQLDVGVGALPNGAAVLQAETLAQAAERGGKKVAQIEWAGGRSGTITGPTLDFRSFLSGRGVATNYISPLDLAPFVTAFGLQFDHPAGFAEAGAVPRGGAGAGHRVDQRAPVLQPGPADAAPGARLRRRQVRAERLLYYDKNDRRTRYDRVLFSTTKDGADAVADLKQGEWADVKVTIQGGSLNGLTGGFLLKVEKLTSDLSQVRLFHTSVTRAIASLADVAGRARVRRRLRRVRRPALPVVAGRRLRRPRGRHRQRGDLRRAGALLGEAVPADHPLRPQDVQAGSRPRRLSGHRRVPASVPRAGHEDPAQRRPQPVVRRRPGQRHAQPSREATRGVHPPRLQGVRRHDAARSGPPREEGPDDVRVVRPRLRPAVPGDQHEQGARRPRSAVPAADVELPPGDRRDDR